MEYVPIVERYCIFDIETETFDNTIDSTKDVLKYIGFKTYQGKKIILHHSEHDKIQAMLNHFDYLVGHNIKLYDIPVLERHGYTIPKTTIIIDTYVIAENRMKPMLYIDLESGDKSLDSLLKRFELPVKKLTFDYSLLKQDRLTGKDYDDLVAYLEADLDGADELFKYWYTFFYGFREMMNEYNQKRMKWLVAKSGSTVYAVICHQLGLKEEYENDDVEANTIQGAFVLQPRKKFCKGRTEYRDASSLYPHIYMMGNLFSPEKGGWNGSGVYPNVYANEVDGIKGSYSRIPGKMESFLKFMYDERTKIKKEMKTLDKNSVDYTRLESKQLTYKILLNSSYGVCNNPIFKNIYNETTASDCTAMARRTTKFAVTVLEEYGYEVLYIDTDGIFVHDVYNDPKKLSEVFECIRAKELESANVKIESHGFKVECVIKCIWFFENDKKELNKKNYIFIDEEGEIHEKGIRIVRGDCSKVAKEVYAKHIKPLIPKCKPFEFTYEQIFKWVKKTAIENPELLLIRKRGKSLDCYKIPEGKEESTALAYHISKRYGVGDHYLVINKRLGVGKENRYCKLEELQAKYQDNWIDQIKLDLYVNDLKCFLEESERKKIKKIKEPVTGEE